MNGIYYMYSMVLIFTLQYLFSKLYCCCLVSHSKTIKYTLWAKRCRNIVLRGGFLNTSFALERQEYRFYVLFKDIVSLLYTIGTTTIHVLVCTMGLIYQLVFEKYEAVLIAGASIRNQQRRIY